MKNLQIAALGLLVVAALMAPTLAQDSTELVKGAPKTAPTAKPATARSAKPATARSAKPLSQKPRWPEAIKGRNARYAVLTRSFDASGDDHEVFVLSYELERLFDKLGDHDEIRKRRQFEKGLKRVIHARLKRDGDPLGDSYQRILATLPLSRRFADFRRTRDLTGDKVELAVWRVDRLRWGDLGPKRIGVRAERLGIAKKREDRRGRLFDERVQDKRQSTKQDQKRTRAETQDENAIEREAARRERILEREADKAEEEAEDEEKDLEREEERELDEETDKAIESAEEGTSVGE